MDTFRLTHLSGIIGRIVAGLMLIFLTMLAACNSGEVATKPGEPKNAPQVVSVAPEGGVPGDTVTITGTNFAAAPGNNVVTFSVVEASVVSANDSVLVVVVPIGALSGTITVAVDSLTGDSPEQFTVRWEEAAYPGVNVNFSDICWTGSQFVAVGQLGAIITSPDGLSWTRHTASPAVSLNAVAAADDEIVAVGLFGSVFRSSGGSIWTNQSSPLSQSDTLVSVAASGSKFVAVPKNRGVVIESPYGVNWALNTVTSSASLRFVLYTNAFSLFTERDTVWYSTTATTWTAINTNLVAPAMTGGAYSGNRTVIVKPNAILSTTESSAGFWTDVTPPASLMSSFDDITWAELFFVAAGPQAIWSIGGVAWHTLAEFPTAPTSAVHVASSPDAVVAVGGFGDKVMVWRKPL